MSDIIYMPFGTRCHAVVLFGEEVHVWTATASRGEEYEKWQGTFLRIERNGRVTRVTIGDHLPVDDELLIREGNTD